MLATNMTDDRNGSHCLQALEALRRTHSPAAAEAARLANDSLEEAEGGLTRAGEWGVELPPTGFGPERGDRHILSSEWQLKPEVAERVHMDEMKYQNIGAQKVGK